jgi:uncharacterized protein YndB with AHSA1/START domain
MSENPKKESIIVEYEFPEDPKKVWRALTDSKLIEAWLMPNNFRPEVGYKFTFKTQPVAGWDGTVNCEVLEVVPERRLVYSWGGGSQKIEGYGHQLDTKVIWDLSPKAGGGTLLRMEHSGFDPESFAFKMMGDGWRRKVSERMKQVVATQV